MVNEKLITLDDLESVWEGTKNGVLESKI